MSPAAVVLWENSRDRVTKGFGPHELLVSCVADRLAEDENWGRERARIRRLVLPLPKNGVQNVIRAVDKHYDKLRSGGAQLLCVLDSDEIRTQLSLPATASDEQILAALQDRAGGAAREVHWLLLDRNVETLVHLAAGVLGRGRPTRKSHQLRDTTLGALSRTAGDWHNRARVLQQMASFAAVVDAVADAVTAAN